jgi:hypothetical protein
MAVLPALPVASTVVPAVAKTFGQKLIAGGAKILGSKLFQTGATQLLQHKSNKKLAQYSFDKNVEMWKMQNEYNSPKLQMARYNEAGLNPNLMYDKGTPGNATTLPQYQGLPTSGEVYGQSLSGLQGMQQMDLTKQQIESTYLDNWLKEYTYYAKVEQQFAITGTARNEEDASHWRMYQSKWSSKIEQIKSSFWEKGINPNDSIFLRGLGMMAERLDQQWLWDILKKLPVDLQKSEMPYYKNYRPFNYKKYDK